jgi:predicted ATP-grasp superfamily ATP-dependent carboligase
LLQQLLKLSESLDKIPVLILTTDAYVEFYVKNRSALEGKFLMNMPDNETVDLLMNKNKFKDFARENGILIPRSCEVRNLADMEKLKGILRFPVIIKPYMRTNNWLASGFKKAYIIPDFEELMELYKTVSVAENYFILQEYIRGNDDHIEYCLTYFSGSGDCKIAFTGQKIRQWPVTTGSTATTIPKRNDWIRDETVRIFKALNYTGFGSIEYKKDEQDGKYYLIEPTVGRLNQQEYVATLAGYNIPLSAYTDLAGIEIRPREPENNTIVYIDELAEIQSVWVHFRRNHLTFSQWIKTLQGKRYYRYFNGDDLGVFCLGLPAKVYFKLLTLVKTIFVRTDHALQ